MPDDQTLLLKKQRAWMAPVLAAVALVAAVGLGAYAWTLRGHLRAAEGDALAQRARGDALAGQLAAGRTAQEQLVACKEQLTAHQAEGDENRRQTVELEAALATCQAGVKDLATQQAQAQKELADVRATTEKFQKMIDAGSVAVDFRDGRMVVKLPDAILFPSGSADLSETGLVAIAEVAAILRQLPDRRFVIAGHTDSVPVAAGKFRSNWELSSARAVAVTEALVKMGIAPENLVAAGHASFDPIARNSSATGRARNRRIEIVLEPQLKPVAVAKTK
jgi:chemotaxis protein MotB